MTFKKPSFDTFECKVRAVVESKYSRGMEDMCDVNTVI